MNQLSSYNFWINPQQDIQTKFTKPMKDRHYIAYANFFKSSKNDVVICPVPVTKAKWRQLKTIGAIFLICCINSFLFVAS